MVDPQTGNRVNTEQLKVGLWEHAFTSPGGSVKDDFIDHDIDRFFLSISDSSKQGQGEIFAALETLSADPNYLDDLNRIRLKEEPSDSGQFLSQPLLLVADHPDDDHKAKALGSGGQQVNPADDNDYDRTHITRLGDVVKVRYPETGSNSEQALAVPKVEKKVGVNIVHFNGAGISKNRIIKHWTTVEERYAQLGIRVEWKLLYKEKLPSGVGTSIAALANSNLNTGQQELSDDVKAIIESKGSHTDDSDVHVFYVSSILQWEGADPEFRAKGFAIPKIAPVSSEELYANNVFIANTAKRYTPGHELGHLLLNGSAVSGSQPSSHHPSSSNIMIDGEDELLSDHGTWVRASKRFDSWQKSRVISDRGGVLANP